MTQALTYFGLGLAAGALFLGLLWLSVRLLATHPRGPRLHALLTPLRLIVLAGALGLVVARGGAVAGLLALGGVMVARLVILRLVRPEAA